MVQDSLLRTVKENLIASHVSRLLQRPEEELDFRSSFIGLGGHSILAVKLASACKKTGIKIPVTSILLSESIQQMMDSATFSEPLPVTKPSGLLTPPTSEDDSMPPTPNNGRRFSTRTSFSTSHHLTEMQMSFVHSNRSSPGSNIINFYEIYESKSIPAMKTAWKKVIESEPIFRSSFISTDKAEINQAPFQWNEIIVDSSEALQVELTKDVTPEDPMCFFDVLTLPQAGTSTIVWRVHHAFVDGFSSQMLYTKLRDVINGRSITAGTPFDEVAKDLESYQKTSQERSKSFWSQQRIKYPQPATEINLPAPASEVPNGVDNISFTVPVEQITSRAREIGVSLASWYQAAWALVLSIYSDSDSVTFGSVLSGRDLPIAGVEDTVGPLINTLPFNVCLDRNASTTEFLRSIFSHSVELGSFQSSVPDDGFVRNFNTALAMEFEMQPSDDHPLRPIDSSWFRVVPDIPLSIYMSFNGNLRICFKLQKYNKADIELLAETYRQAILSLLLPTKTVEQCLSSLLSSESRQSLMRFGNCLSDQTSPSAITEDLITLYERAARDNPGAIALKKGEKQLTYAEFDGLAGRLAYQLQNLVQPGDIICVHADRSINWIIAMYGILKTRAVYSAQDAALPQQIRNTNFETAGAKIFLTPAAAQKSFKPESCSTCLSVEELLSESSDQLLPHRQSPLPRDNAYLCFTSGSTGKPKGVMCHHAGLVAFQKDLEVRLFAAPGQKISQLMSPAFDGSIHEIFSALSYGATLVLAGSADPFAQLQESTAAILTPSIAKILDPDDFPSLRNVYLVGEPVPQYVCDIWSSKKALYNMYGPTEATCGATIQRLRPGIRVNIGPPNPTTRVYILDRNQQLLPPGVVGEIFLAGVQVARGYIGRPELTAERFLPDTICNRSGETMYRTGDRGYFNRLGEVECLGRNDRQIKLRGFRLDMNDLEIRVASAVPEATAVAICPKDDYLVMMIQPETLEAANVRSRIVKVLPVHAVPRHTVPVEKFPMTPAGKLDYKEIAIQCIPTTQVAKSPSSTLELKLAQIWREVLGLPADVVIDRDSNFVALGGHSVMQLRLASKLSTEYGSNIPLSFIVASTNLAELAYSIGPIASKKARHASRRLEPLGRAKVSPIEQEWYEKYNLNLGTFSFNVTYACAIDSAEVNIDHLVASWNAVLARHAIFRSRYLPSKNGKGARRAYAKFPPQVIRVRALNLWREVNRPFQLARQPPIRITISNTHMLASISHIIADLTTLQVLLKEVTRMYNCQGIPLIKHTYADTTQWSSPATSAQKSWWSQYLAGSSNPTYSLPHATLTSRSSYAGKSHLQKLSPSLSAALLSFSASQNVTLHQLALGAVALALQPSQAATDVVLGGPYLNRTQDDLDTVGLFLEPIPMRIRTPPTEEGEAPDPTPFIDHVKFCSQQALAHAVPWSQILAAVAEGAEGQGEGEGRKEGFPNHPLLDVMVTFHDQRAGAGNGMEIAGLSPLVTYTKGSKFALLVEFCALEGGAVSLRLEYDTACVPEKYVGEVAGIVLRALRGVLEGKGEGEIKRALREPVQREEKLVEEVGGKWFGMKVADI